MSNSRTRFGFVAAICLIAAVPAGAQPAANQAPIAELTLEQLMTVEVAKVFGASRYQQLVTDAPAAVSIITDEEIERFGYRTLADVLRGVRGFYVTNDHNYSYLGVRGFSRPGDYNSRVLILLDGHRLNETVYDSAYIGADFPAPIELIERVEVVRGPSSSLYGTSAFFAVVNVVTKKAASLGALRVTGEAGSQNTRMGTMTFGHQRANGTGVVLGASAYGSGGESAFPVPALGIARDMDDEDAWSVFASATRGRWSMQALYASRNKQIPTGAFGVALDDPRSQTDDDRGYIEATYDGAWRGFGLAWRASYDSYRYAGRYAVAPEVENQPTSVLEDLTRADWLGTELMLTRRVARRHFLTGGVEYRHSLHQDQEAWALDPYDVYLDLDTSSRALGIYAQDEFTVSSRLTLSAGVRRDQQSNSSGSTNLRVAAIVKPISGAALKLLHGSAFRAPNPYEVFYYPGPTLLTPERIRTSEIIWEQYAKAGLRVSASAFYYCADDLISQVPSEHGRDGFVFANVEGARAPGVELEAERAWREWNLLASYTFQNVKSHPDGLALSNSPRHLGRTRVTGPVINRLVFIGVEGLFTGERTTLEHNIAEGAFLGNLTLTTRELSRAKVAITVGNLLDRHYVDPGAEEHPGDVIAQQGRTLRARVTWRF